ncbi:hypothetical protein BRAS3809_350007 [Bradyrhizobium sp. STM 3809]|nr:hypothetical protein BRAS3809_350007 [Bradyrhizobium sp. STM 3809]
MPKQKAGIGPSAPTPTLPAAESPESEIVVNDWLRVSGAYAGMSRFWTSWMFKLNRRCIRRLKVGPRR